MSSGGRNVYTLTYDARHQTSADAMEIAQSLKSMLPETDMLVVTPNFYQLQQISKENILDMRNCLDAILRSLDNEE